MWTPTQGYRKRVKHYETGDARFLTFSCHQRLPLLSKDRTCRWFVEALHKARKAHGFELWAWVIMPEHVHLLIWPRAAAGEPERGVSRILADIKRPVAQQAITYLEQHAREFLPRLTVRNKNRTYRRFWQAGSGYDENIDDPAALHEIATYIHNNPVRRGLVQRPEDWRWSSARDWLHHAADVDCPVDRTMPAALEIPVSPRKSRI
jgi:putative transposase